MRTEPTPHWRNLAIHDRGGPTGETMGSLLDAAPGNFDTLTLDADGKPDRLPEITLPGELDELGRIKSWTTCHLPGGEQADWSGFAAALHAARDA